MAYRILADENVERATVNYLRKLGADDASIARHAREHDRLILSQDDDFFTELDVKDTAGVLFQKDQTLSTHEVGDIVHELSQSLDQSDITLEYVSKNWL